LGVFFIGSKSEVGSGSASGKKGGTIWRLHCAGKDFLHPFGSGKSYTYLNYENDKKILILFFTGPEMYRYNLT
jgi:hypothetical protein